jgi:NADPH2:quinone reductase
MSMKAWRVHQWGSPATDVLQLDTVDIPEPGDGELLVKNSAIPLNLNDMERITGGNMMVTPELPLIPGMEVMGVVDACGGGAEAWQGKSVIAMPRGANGGYAEYSVCPVVSAFEIPSDIPLPDAAALYFPFHLAWLGLFDRAELQAGETVLIHAAAGGSGSAAVQLAVNAGARVFATAGSAEKVALCEKLGAEVAINYNDGGEQDFADIVMEKTNNKGVDVVFDNVGEDVMDRSMHCIAYNGRYLMMGFASDKARADEKLIVPRRVSAGNFRLCGVLLAYAPDAVAPLMKKGMGWNFCSDALGEKITNEIVALYRAGKIQPSIGNVIDFADIPTEIDALFGRKTLGRSIAML